MYVTGRLIGLDPVSDAGRGVSVWGTVRIDGGRPYLEAEGVSLGASP